MSFVRIDLIMDDDVYSFCSVKEFTDFVECARMQGEKGVACVAVTVRFNECLLYTLDFETLPGGACNE